MSRKKPARGRDPRVAAGFAKKDMLEHVPLIPAQAGIQRGVRERNWVPAFAGTSGQGIDRVRSERALK